MPKNRAASSKTNVSGNKGQIGRETYCKVQAVESTQRAVKLGNPISCHCLVALVNIKNADKVTMKTDCGASIPQGALGNESKEDLS